MIAAFNLSLTLKTSERFSCHYCGGGGGWSKMTPKASNKYLLLLSKKEQMFDESDPR